ncbi:succinate--CoA ligase subunit alpha [Fodinicurvata halophila]|uniref:Succinate--CoA ligase subunit alpha n=1 Tax=Fodinicurvata halophila TaxID=1419723 RepID=A0ABV8UMH5_9PROT
MAILVDANSRILIQGITGHTGRNLAQKMRAENSPLVGGVSPKRAGETVDDLPVYASCYEAVAASGANCSFVSVPAPLACEAALEAIDAGIATLVIYTEGVPIMDAIQISAYARSRGVRVLGPNAAGCISPDLANLSDLNAALLRRGPIGIVSKSGTLTYEVIETLNAHGLGQSTVACLGGDPVVGMSHGEVLDLFEADPETEAVVLIGEIGGRSELDAAERVTRMRKPVVAYIAGLHAPPGKRMGHAGAMLGSPEENVPGKRAALETAGASVVDDVMGIGEALRRVMVPAGAG